MAATQTKGGPEKGNLIVVHRGCHFEGGDTRLTPTMIPRHCNFYTNLSVSVSVYLESWLSPFSFGRYDAESFLCFEFGRASVDRVNLIVLSENIPG